MGKLYQLTKSAHREGRKDQKERRQPHKGKGIMKCFAFESSKSTRQKGLRKESNFESEWS